MSEKRDVIASLAFVFLLATIRVSSSCNSWPNRKSAVGLHKSTYFEIITGVVIENINIISTDKRHFPIMLTHPHPFLLLCMFNATKLSVCSHSTLENIN